MNSRLAFCLLLLATLAGCDLPDVEKAAANAVAATSTRELYRLHDDELGVTCWHLGSGTLECIPDWMLRGPDQAGNERQLSPHETQPEPTPAAAPAAWNDERYQL